MSLYDIIEQHLAGAGLTAGYKMIWYRWREEDSQQQAEPFICIRRVGGGTSDEFGQNPTVLMQVCGRPNAIRETDEHIRLIKSHFINNYCQPGVALFQIAGDINGPFMFNNDRPLFELNITAMAANGL
ncbi:phage tail termination protein [Carnimonas bestiolae]|uniref:phage tail termination protein n=1 Tax=Carnimonas bestiolae TaxID=3402172 RepID=UPI003EDC6727